MKAKEEIKFKFTCKTERIIGETKDRYICKTTKKEISKTEVIQLLRRGYFGGFKKYAFWYKKGKYFYGKKESNTFKGILDKIAKESKKKTINLSIYTRK